MTTLYIDCPECDQTGVRKRGRSHGAACSCLARLVVPFAFQAEQVDRLTDELRRRDLRIRGLEQEVSAERSLREEAVRMLPLSDPNLETVLKWLHDTGPENRKVVLNRLRFLLSCEGAGPIVFDRMPTKAPPSQGG